MKKLITVFLMCTGSLMAQNFTMEITEKVNGNSGEMKGVPGDVLTADLLFTNPTPNLLRLSINRYLNDIPPYWTLCYCYTQCYSPVDDTITVALAPLTSSLVTLYYKTDSVNPGIAHASFKISEMGSSYTDTLYVTASTLDYTGAGPETKASAKLILYPNPAASELNLKLNAGGLVSLTLLNATGVLVRQSMLQSAPDHRLDISDLPPGFYFVRINTSTENLNVPFIKL